MQVDDILGKQVSFFPKTEKQKTKKTTPIIDRQEKPTKEEPQEEQVEQVEQNQQEVDSPLENNYLGVIDDEKLSRQVAKGYVLMYSKFLKEEFLLITIKDKFSEAKRAYPDRTIYFEPEMREMLRMLLTIESNDDRMNFVRKTHEVKKLFHGWIIPKKGSDGKVAFTKS